MPPMSYH